MKDTSSCPHEGYGSCEEGDKLLSIAKHPKGIVSFANSIKVYREIYWQWCSGMAHLLADKAGVRQYYLLMMVLGNIIN